MNMKLKLSLSKKVEGRILKNLLGRPFSVSDFPREWSRSTVITILHRLIKKGIVKKLKRGLYYLPERSEMYGEVSPGSRDILEKIEAGDKDIVPTGGYLFNLLGLSTQVPTVYKYLHNKSNNKTEVAGLKIEFKKSKVPIYSNTKKFFKFLEVAENIELIPDKNINTCIEWFNDELKEITEREIPTLIRMSMFYSSKTRALVCAILDELYFSGGFESDFRKLKLKESSRYNVGRIADKLISAKKWRLFKARPRKTMDSKYETA